MIPLYEMSIEANPERWKGNSSSQGTPPPTQGGGKSEDMCFFLWGDENIQKLTVQIPAQFC